MTTQGQRYWRSLDRLLDSPVVREQLASEFPEGASLPPEGFTRRGMLKLMGASFALAGLASCRRPEELIVPFVAAPEELVPGVPKHYATTMPFGTSAYGLLVESHDGRPTKIEGNELHPSSRGAASSWMQASVLDLYDPDRSRHVIRREPGGQRNDSSWEDFLSFWTEVAASAVETGGAGLAVLTEAYSSPSIARLARQFRERFPESRWVVYEPAGDENVFEGIRLATGRPYRPVYQLEKAKRILSLGADFLLTESESVRHAKGFAASRRPSEDMSRLYVVESTLSLTGANADHRLALPCRDIAAFIASLATELRGQGLSLEIPETAVTPPWPAWEESVRERLRVIAEDLAAFPGEAVVIAGRDQPKEVHALALAINHALGAMGQTVSLAELDDAGWSQPSELELLSEEMTRGTISTLVVLGGNPVYTAPAGWKFAEALEQVEHTIHLSTHSNETSQRCEWHLPQAHFLESWGDARAADGSASIVQPLVAPLYEGRSHIELLDLLAHDRESPGYGLVRDTWLGSILGDEDVESRWNRALHDGVLVGSARVSSSVEIDGDGVRRSLESALRPVDRDSLEIAFPLSSTLHDGRFTNNGWLQELPDPITKLTWDNAALVGPATAKSLQIGTGDVVTLEVDGARVGVPVLVLPGQAEGSVALSLGYGRTACGRVGDGVGVSAYSIRPSSGLFASGLRVERTERTHDFAQTQQHWEMEGRELVKETTLAEYRDQPDVVSSHRSEPLPLWEEHSYAESPQWGMSIDLNACIGCNACVTACQSENNIPIVGKEQVARSREMHWLRIDRYVAGTPDNPEVVFQPVPCMHCENAPCEQVCPVGATVHSEDGLNTMVYNRCIGTRYCSNNCPYKVRRFNFFNYTKDLPETLQMLMNPDVTVRSRGVMEKCTYCVQRINAVRIEAKQTDRAIRDGEVRTACQQTCPVEAIVFGDINDLQSDVAQQKADPRHYVLLEELHHKPRTSFLAKLRNPNPAWEAH